MGSYCKENNPEPKNLLRNLISFTYILFILFDSWDTIYICSPNDLLQIYLLNKCVFLKNVSLIITFKH